MYKGPRVIVSIQKMVATVINLTEKEEGCLPIFCLEWQLSKGRKGR
jgi:hypothetical protein